MAKRKLHKVVRTLLDACDSDVRTDAEIGIEAGLSKNTIQSWRRHGTHPALDTAEKVANLLGFRITIQRTHPEDA